MKLIVCLDNHNAMAFNRRRQSRDREITERISTLVGDCALWMGKNSKTLFGDLQLHICVSDDYLHTAGNEDFCFAEIDDVSSYMDKVSEIYIFRWNRDYPFDLLFPTEVLKRDFHLVEAVCFKGYSHPELTLEVYTR